MTPRERNGFIEWTALGLLAHNICAFQMPKGTSFGFMLREALEESDAPYHFDLYEDPDKIIENSINHSRYQIFDARWDGFTYNNNYCLAVRFVSSAEQNAFTSGEDGLCLVAEIYQKEPEVIKKMSFYRFGEFMMKKLKSEDCSMYTYRKEDE